MRKFNSDALDRAPRRRSNIYLVVADLGQPGRIWREADVEHTDLETVILDLLEGQAQKPGPRRLRQHQGASTSPDAGSAKSHD